MTFSEYAQGLSPFCSRGASEYEYFTELVENFIEDAAMDACKILSKKDDTKYRYIIGSRQIQPKDAQYLYNHRDLSKFSEWIWNTMDYSDSYDGVSNWLKKNNIDNSDPPTACAELLESIILDIINGVPKQNQSAQDAGSDMALITDIQDKIKQLPRPASVPVPEEATNDEQLYINELFRAYGDAEGLDTFSRDDLVMYPDYEEDLEDRRVDFYAAESIRRGVMELGDGDLSDQFDVLKDETYNGVKDTVRRVHLNGYECMLAVMEQAVKVPVDNYLLGASPYWISGKIKKGVCHHLVNDEKLVWVRRKRK